MPLLVPTEEQKLTSPCCRSGECQPPAGEHYRLSDRGGECRGGGAPGQEGGGGGGRGRGRGRDTRQG
jgi:hypothetical protein